MGKYSKKQAADVQTISTLGGDCALKWDDETQMSVNAHAATIRSVGGVAINEGRREVQPLQFLDVLMDR